MQLCEQSFAAHLLTWWRGLAAVARGERELQRLRQEHQVQLQQTARRSAVAAAEELAARLALQLERGVAMVTFAAWQQEVAGARLAWRDVLRCRRVLSWQEKVGTARLAAWRRGAVLLEVLSACRGVLLEVIAAWREVAHSEHMRSGGHPRQAASSAR